jgi:hypothetical protein
MKRVHEPNDYAFYNLADEKGNLVFKRIREAIPMKRTLSAVLACCLASATPLTGAVEGKRAMYIGGTVASIPEKQQGTLDTSGASEFVFTWDKGKWNVPFANINKLVYREKVGRHVGATIATTAAVGVSGLFVLLAKKKKHYLSLEWKDEPGQVQVAAFELSKDAFENVIANLEEKTGLHLQVEVQEAPKKK